VIRPESLEFPPLNCSLDRQLGGYYQDFSQAIGLVEEGSYGSPALDGAPQIAHTGKGDRRNAIITAQYALANMTVAARGNGSRMELARRLLNSLIATQEPRGEWAGCWLIKYDNPKYPWLTAPWTSAMASGHAISALLRGWELFGLESYLTAAEAAYQALHRPRTGTRLYEEMGNELWYEEYPALPPVRVLNGHVYCLLGVADYARVSGDPEADSRWRRAAATAIAHLRDFDLGYWSAYDLRWREPTSIHYHKNIHIPQLRVLAALTDDPRPAQTANRWDRYLHSPFCRLRWIVATRAHQWHARPPWASRAMDKRRLETLRSRIRPSVDDRD
jgi:hypothetical protein